ncbi:hypothetical protein PYW07_004872 [Mythimna separata]|uniref:Enkurin domain-containing protein n=1 Tax=Mythimna separata TaxID=271217 RepID=A0AAD7YEH4_MYTSE|nr:hypothetical protein PYW07_004872 [Mythimna separata]
MYTLKGIFPEPKKEQKKNFIRENMKQLKYIQSQKSPKEPKYNTKNVHPPRLTNPVATGSSLGAVKSSPSNRSGKVTLNIAKTSSTNARKKVADIKIKKGDMAEFLKRKELRQVKPPMEDFTDEEVKSSSSSGRLRDIGCQTMESNLSQKLADSTKLTMLYPKKECDESEANLKASGDTGLHRSPPPSSTGPRRAGDDLIENRSRLNAILERKDTKDPYLPSGYQKGVLPKYLRERKEQGPKESEGVRADDDQSVCPSGHVTLPDTERKETLRMLRNSFAELVSELNKLPVKTDTLKMRNRKMELEKQLAKLEEGIKVFSRPKVFVKIGE